MWVVWFGASMAVCGLVYLAFDSILSRQAGRETEARKDAAGRTGTPRREVGFLGTTRSWPGAVMVVVGMGLLLVGAAA